MIHGLSVELSSSQFCNKECKNQEDEKMNRLENSSPSRLLLILPLFLPLSTMPQSHQPTLMPLQAPIIVRHCPSIATIIHVAVVKWKLDFHSLALGAHRRKSSKSMSITIQMNGGGFVHKKLPLKLSIIGSLKGGLIQKLKNEGMRVYPVTEKEECNLS